MGPRISFQNVTVTRRRPDGEVVTILNRASFELPSGARTAVIGPSGSGKTTLLRLINRLDDVDKGVIALDGVDVRTFPAPELRRRVGIVFQQPRLFDATVLENLDRPLGLAGRQALDRKDAADALRQVDLPASLLDSHSRELSVGQQQRVAIARALVLEPRALLLDEPTSALDQRSAEHVLSLLIRVNETRAMSMVMVSHVLEHAGIFSDCVLALRDGQARMFDALEPAATWALPSQEIVSA